MQGTVRGSGGAIRNIGHDAYPIRPEGWIVDDLIATDLASLSAISGASIASLAPADPALASATAAQQTARDACKALRVQLELAISALR